MISRRQFLAAAASTLATATGGGGTRAACSRASTLAQAAASANILFGASIGVDVLDDKAYVDLLLAETRILTTDLAFKLPFICPERGRFDFGQSDRLVAFARAHKRPLRAHTLFWDLSNPDWVGKLSVRERIAEMDRLIDTIVPRYSGKLHSWDVVNEPFWPGFGEPGGFRRGPWYDAMGRDYVMRAFRRVSALDPGAKLVLNIDMTERNDELGRSVRQATLGLIDDMRAKGVRLDAVGLQGHLDPALPFDAGAFAAFLHEVAARRVAIYVTELDVLDTSLDEDVAVRDAKVAAHYGGFLRAVLEEPAVAMIGTWQLADSRSWYRSDWYRSVTPTLPSGWQARPLPFDDALRAKPARDAMIEAFCSRKS